MSISEPEFLEYMKKMFLKHGSNYEIIQEKLSKNSSSIKERDRLPVYGHFYYFICAPENSETREELQIVGLTSLIEAMMGDVEFKDPFQYYKSEFSKKNNTIDFDKFELEYQEKYSATKRIVRYFNEYIPANDISSIIKKLQRIDKQTGTMTPFNNLDQVAKFLYQMRSEFVHEAEMQCFCPKHCFAAMLSVGGKIYDVRVNIAEILDIFEKSFVAFWQKKSLSIK